jgi:hypothetical protein
MTTILLAIVSGLPSTTKTRRLKCISATHIYQIVQGIIEWCNILRSVALHYLDAYQRHAPPDHQCQMQRSTAFQSELKNVVSMRYTAPHQGISAQDHPRLTD